MQCVWSLVLREYIDTTKHEKQNERMKTKRTNDQGHYMNTKEASLAKLVLGIIISQSSERVKHKMDSRAFKQLWLMGMAAKVCLCFCWEDAVSFVCVAVCVSLFLFFNSVNGVEFSDRVPLFVFCFHHLCSFFKKICSFYSLSLLKNMGDANNKNEGNPAQATENLSGVGTVARKASTSTDINNNSTRDRVWGDTHTEPTPSHNSN